MSISKIKKVAEGRGGKREGAGRPRTDATPVLVRLLPGDLAALDAWLARHPEIETRPEAIRQAVRRMTGDR